MQELFDLFYEAADTDAIFAELGEVIGGQKNGRSNSEQITYFKSVGVAIQDAVAGRIALENAIALDLGTVISLD